MASEDEMWDEMLKTEVSVDSVLKRIDREKKELQSLKDEKDTAETKEKILAIEESIDEDKKWISMQKKSQPEVVITQPPPKIDDIVANDTEIIRICSEISTFLINNANHRYITELVQARHRGSAKYNIPSFIGPIRWYVRDIIKPKGLSITNLKKDIEAMETSLKWINVVDLPAERTIQNRFYGSVSVYGVPFFQEIYDNVLLKPGDGMIDRNIAIQYVSLVLQLHRRIQAIMVENGFQQGGKRKTTIKRGRKTRKTKMYKKIRTTRKK
jgi:hypothetical protein